MRIKEKLQHIIKNSLNKIEIDKKLNEIIIESSNDNNFVYYTNISICLSKDLHKKPEEIAEMLKDIIKDEMIDHLEVAYPGTLNIYLNKKSLLKGITEIIEKNINYGKSNIGLSRKINIDFIDFDFSKDLTKENIFNAIYSDNLSRILKYNGFDISKELYILDNSKEIEKLANITRERYINICKKESNICINYRESEGIRDTAYLIYNLYRNNKLDENLEYFKKEEISTLLEKRKRDLDKYRINFDIYTNENSLYEKGLIDTILDKLNRNGHTYFFEDNLWLKTTNYNDNEDRLLIKEDGTYTYLLPHISYYIDKINRKYTGIISMYNKEYRDYKKATLTSLQMLDQDTNKIEIKLLPDVKIIKEKEELNDIQILKELSVNEIRYLFSAQNEKEEININLDFINNKNENPIYYIENTNIIINEILSNYKKKITKANNFSTIDSQPAYIMLNKLYEFEDIVIKSGLKQMPHLICNYLCELCDLFHDYYNKEVIITEDEIYTNERLNLLLAIKIVINNALDLIGIIPREEM